jgi:hypothetical protein
MPEQTHDADFEEVLAELRLEFVPLGARVTAILVASISPTPATADLNSGPLLQKLR